MTYTAKQKKTLLETTEGLMKTAGIVVRDTWYGYDDINLDDYFTHDKRWNEPKLFDVLKIKSGKAHITMNQIYPVPFHDCAAYDCFRIYIPENQMQFKSSFIHECVHFLQYNTVELDSAYIRYNGRNHIEYLSQRCELEAHFVQLMYIVEHEIYEMELGLRSEFHNRLKESLADPSNRLNLIKFANRHHLI